MSNYYLIHIIVFTAGLVLYVFPPRRVNWIYGYRTSASMKNDVIFKFANNFSSKLLMLFTVISFIICLAADEVFHFHYLGWLIFLVLGLTILFTEIKLKKINNSENI